MKLNLHTSLHHIKGLASQGCLCGKGNELLAKIYDETEKALRQDKEELAQKKSNPELSGRYVPYIKP